jgi:hypothetical protein
MDDPAAEIPFVKVSPPPKEAQRSAVTIYQTTDMLPMCSSPFITLNSPLLFRFPLFYDK